MQPKLKAGLIGFLNLNLIINGKHVNVFIMVVIYTVYKLIGEKGLGIIMVNIFIGAVVVHLANPGSIPNQVTAIDDQIIKI